MIFLARPGFKAGAGIDPPRLTDLYGSGDISFVEAAGNNRAIGESGGQGPVKRLAGTSVKRRWAVHKKSFDAAIRRRNFHGPDGSPDAEGTGQMRGDVAAVKLKDIQRHSGCRFDKILFSRIHEHSNPEIAAGNGLRNLLRAKRSDVARAPRIEVEA